MEAAGFGKEPARCLKALLADRPVAGVVDTTEFVAAVPGEIAAEASLDRFLSLGLALARALSS